MEELSLLDELLIWLGLKEAPIQKQQAETPKPEPEKIEAPSEPTPEEPEAIKQYPDETPKRKTKGVYPI